MVKKIINKPYIYFHEELDKTYWNFQNFFLIAVYGITKTKIIRLSKLMPPAATGHNHGWCLHKHIHLNTTNTYFGSKPCYLMTKTITNPDNQSQNWTKNVNMQSRREYHTQFPEAGSQLRLELLGIDSVFLDGWFIQDTVCGLRSSGPLKFHGRLRAFMDWNTRTHVYNSGESFIYSFNLQLLQW